MRCGPSIYGYEIEIRSTWSPDARSYRFGSKDLHFKLWIHGWLPILSWRRILMLLIRVLVGRPKKWENYPNPRGIFQVWAAHFGREFVPWFTSINRASSSLSRCVIAVTPGSRGRSVDVGTQRRSAGFEWRHVLHRTCILLYMWSWTWTVPVDFETLSAQFVI